jgi:hypothetical protein
MSDLNIKKIDPTQIRYEPVEGEVIQTPEGEYLMWHDGAWNKFKMDGSGIEVGLYDMNKQIISQLPPLSDRGFEKAIKDITFLHTAYQNEYYMLYGKEISYFSLFKIIESERLAEAIFECCVNVGTVKAIDLTENQDAIEIWVENEDGPTCLYFFPYDNGLVQVGE